MSTSGRPRENAVKTFGSSGPNSSATNTAGISARPSKAAA